MSRLNREPGNQIGISLHSLDKDAIAFFAEQRHPLTRTGKAFGWSGRVDEDYFWELVRKSYEKGFAVMLTRTLPASDKDSNLPLYCLRLDSNKWSFRQH